MTSYMEKDDNMLEVAKRRAFLYVQADRLVGSLGLDVCGGEERYLLVTCRCSLLTGQNCCSQTGYNDFEI